MECSGLIQKQGSLDAKNGWECFARLPSKLQREKLRPEPLSLLYLSCSLSVLEAMSTEALLLLASLVTLGKLRQLLVPLSSYLWYGVKVALISGGSVL